MNLKKTSYITMDFKYYSFYIVNNQEKEEPSKQEPSQEKQEPVKQKEPPTEEKVNKYTQYDSAY
jgi:hypothetical protein